ncbi:post-GPI attachment to proteins factor 4 [Equus quagga]|uniref:Post-GPI attachment to proteins factor 4 n=1 Tax=Equus przewalskii TaxID=9798 RepID=A0ABM4MFD4_EQUPR|nr:PREDICTED: transmembrane protein 246 [Equus przewalskii]XP_008520695.1 PREDICTED: transmembrane protein 246 [Equus przewalskii]XP_008520696.1 PREDICTED: transmembrane protein 246 [Equus przewalskii]XP_008520697.1 PREDICTED: transmembrane protein 246 [Equus przewalskii]XP_008520698.1 PREDICTED: transmembrane protein 246 [Equus przewalskii]XP_008520699.1 PREDICTED: transmembrane protein 246 [Equus przewalskii]XP_046542149.1 post-GPI attachment to proteins factor 4 [Equus quagga]XP_046542157
MSTSTSPAAMLLRRLRRLSWGSTAVQLFILTVVTFGLLAPLACHRLLHSYFYLRHWHLNQMSQEFLQQSLKEGEAALHYFEELPSANGSVPIVWQATPRPWLVITIITVDRQPGFHYVLQVVSQFHRLLQQCGPQCEGHQLFLCNVERSVSHFDAKLLSKYVPVANRYEGTEDDYGDDPSTNSFEKEKQDYVYCLESSLQTYNPDYVLMVEDDAVPEEQIFPVLEHLLRARFSEPHLRDALYLKLYHPERLQHYINPEPMRILEWVGVGMLLGPLLTWIYMRFASRPGFSWPVMLFFSLYSMGLVELVGRHYFLELRRLSPSLYNVVPASQCCTPAMLFPAPAARRTLTYLSQVYCHKGFGKDMALYSLLRAKGERAYVVEPNLVKHIGLFSSLRYNFHPSLL